MDQQTNNVAENSETLASAMDVINLHPDKHDVLNVNNEIDQATEDNLLNQGETLPTRAPRPLFMGPTKKNRRARGARKNTNKSAETPLENANQSTPVRNETSVHKPTNVNIKWTPSINENNSVAQSTDQNHLASKTPKRARSTQPSPNVSNSGVPSMPKKQKTYADVIANDLKLQICNKPNGIDNYQLIDIEKGLMGELDKYLAMIPAPMSAPTFHTSSFNNGILKLICADTFSADWIKSTVTNMQPPWEGANLEISGCEPPNRQPNANHMASNRQRRNQRVITPRRPTIRFFIPSGVKKPTFEEVAMRLKMQNNPLDTSNWIAWRAEEKEDGIFYHVSVDDPVIEFIKAKNSRLFYCFSKIKINLPKEPKGASSKEGDAMEGVETEKAE